MGPVALKVTCSSAVWSNVHMVPAATNTAGSSGVVALILTNTADVFSVNVSIEGSPGTPTVMVVAPFGIMICTGKLGGRDEKGGGGGGERERRNRRGGGGERKEEEEREELGMND